MKMSLWMWETNWMKTPLWHGKLCTCVAFIFLRCFGNLFWVFWVYWFGVRPGVQMRRTSWQDGVLGTNCPIPPTWNWTYNFQVKDQIGSFFYFPSLNFQRAAGGFGSFIITNRKVISLPYKMPDGDIVISIGDWYTKNHTVRNCC